MTTTEDTAPAADEDTRDDQPQDAQPGTDMAERDPRDNGTIEVMPPAREVSLAALGTLRDHVASMREAKFFADVVCSSKLVPQRFQGEPNDGAAAILFGAELGLSPIASLRSVIVVHGTPGLEARTMKGLLKSKGYGFRTIEQSDTVHEIWAWEPDSPKIFDDRGQRVSPDETARITIEDCVLEGWVPQPVKGSQKRPHVKEDWEGDERSGSRGKYWVVRGNMKYITSPRTMLRAKATAEVCRAIAPHVLLGLPYSSDELADFSDDQFDDQPQQQRRQPSKARGMDGLRDRARQAHADDNIQDAEVVEDPPADLVEEQQLPVDDGPTITREEGVTGEDLPGPGADEAQAEPAPEDAPPADEPKPAKQKSQRDKAMGAMHALFNEGKMGDRQERLDATAEIIAKRPHAEYRRLESSNDLQAIELRYLVDTLEDWKKRGKLVDWLVEALNAATIREAGLREDG